MNNPTLYLVGGIFLILFFCVMTYFFTKTFRALHVVVLFFTFGLAMWFVAMAALSHKTKLHWRQQVDRLQKELDGYVYEKNLLVNNYILDENGKWPETVLTARSKLNRVMLDRGRVWRGCSVAAVNNGQIQVNTAPAGEADPAPNQISESALLYVFTEGDAGVSVKVPNNYLGEFVATAVTATSVTLTPTDNRMLLPSQTAAINASAGAADVTWALYEVMPIDSHQIYAADPNEDINLTAVENQAIFGAMDENLIQTLYNPNNFIAEFRANLGFAQGSPQEAAALARLNYIMESIKRDGGAPNTGNQAAGGNVDPEDNIYVKVQFNEKYDVEVDSDSGQGGLTSNYFDSQGRAVVDRLRRARLGFLGEPSTSISFDKGGFGVFHQKKADELVEQNIVNPIEPRYVRTLIDFTYEFHKMLERRTKISQDVQRLNAEITKVRDAEKGTVIQRDFRKNERDRLTADKAKFVAEQQRVATYQSELQTKLTKLKAELSALYRSNASLAAQLDARNKQLTDEIDRRTEAATATASN